LTSSPVYGGLDLIPLPKGQGSLYRQSSGPLTMAKIPYNSGWVTRQVGPQPRNIVFEVWRRLPGSHLGSRVLTDMAGAYDSFPWCCHLDLLCLVAAKLSLVGGDVEVLRYHLY
jgi:hypothetical protein